MYNYIIVGAGLFGAVFAQQAKAAGKSVLVIDKRNHIAGNVYTEKEEGIDFHKYGAHIFHTNNKAVWNYVNQFVEFNRFLLLFGNGGIGLAMYVSFCGYSLLE